MTDSVAELQPLLAKEALRQVELRLGDQATALTALEARATSIIGWALAGVVASGAALLSPVAASATTWAAAGLIAGLAGAITASCLILRPEDWGVRGHSANYILDAAEWAEVEADLLEALAKSSAEVVSDNSRRLAKASTYLKRAILFLSLAPALAAMCAIFAALAGA